MNKKRSKSSNAWLLRQNFDKYTALSKQQGYRSRAVYKLLEIQQKEHIITPGMTIVDLGAAPGGFSQLAQEYLKGHGKIVALDLLPIVPIDGVDIIIGDFRQDVILDQLFDKLSGSKVDLVMSDMAPNFSGVIAVDIPRAIYLAELALEFALKNLSTKGIFLVKLFQGEGFMEYHKNLLKQFTVVKMFKPKASRSESREIYAIARNLKK